MSRLKGSVPWNKGLTKETDARVAANASALVGANSRKTPYMKGRSHTEESKRSMSVAHQGHMHSADQKRKIADKLKGRRSPMTGKHHSDVTRSSISSRLIGISRSEETKQKMSVAAISRLAENRPRPMYKGTLPERQMEQILIEMGLVYEKQKWIGRAVPDFVIRGCGGVLAIEVDGCYYHGCSTCYPDLSDWQRDRQSADRQKEERFNSLCIKWIRFWECEIRESREIVRDRLVAKLREIKISHGSVAS